MPLEFTEREIAPDITVVELIGTLALGRESQRIETLVDDLAKRGSTRVIFDMTGVDYMDSAGLGMLALANGKLKESGGSLVIVAPRRPRSGAAEPHADQPDREGLSHAGSRRSGALSCRAKSRRCVIYSKFHATLHGPVAQLVRALP